MWVRDHSRSLKAAPFQSLGTVSYSPSIVIMAVSLLVCHCKFQFYLVPFASYLTLNNIVALKSGLEVTQDHSNWYIRKLGAVSYSPSIITMALSRIISEIKRNIGRKSSFFIPHLHSTPALRELPSEQCHDVYWKSQNGLAARRLKNLKMHLFVINVKNFNVSIEGCHNTMW